MYSLYICRSALERDRHRGLALLAAKREHGLLHMRMIRERCLDTRLYSEQKRLVRILWDRIVSIDAYLAGNEQ